MDDWKPDNRRMVRNVELYYQPNIPSKKDTDYYYWVVPASVAGAWRWSVALERVYIGRKRRLYPTSNPAISRDSG
jgi:hypothetical protein